MAKKTKGNRVQCEHCNIWIDKKSYVRHIRNQHEDLCGDKKEYKCDLCPVEFYQPSELSKHKFAVHNQEPEPRVQPQEQPQNEVKTSGKRTEKIKSDVCTIQCAQCPQICANMKVYHQHMKFKHTLKCEKCSYTTVHPKKYRFHVKKRHAKDKKSGKSNFA